MRLLSWTLTIFLTKEDPRAAIKGSRDPLGLQPIWNRLGHHLIPNLTSQSNSARGFTILILSRFLTERLIDGGKLKHDEAVDAFLHMEQIGAYVRHVVHQVGGDIRGINRVRANTENGRFNISTRSEDQIMSNQKAYGLWGLFSVSARVSGLIEDDQIRVTQPVREFVENSYLPTLESSNVLEPLNRLLCEGGKLGNSNADPIFKALGKVLNPEFDELERAFYRDYLCLGKHVAPKPAFHQHALAELVFKEWDLETPLSLNKLESLRELARNLDPVLFRRLDQVIRSDAVMAVMARVFDHILSRHGYSTHEIRDELSNAWGSGIPNINPSENQDLLAEVNGCYEGGKVSSLFDNCQIAICNGRWAEVIEMLVQWNQLIQARRDSAPWVRITANKLDVRFQMPSRPLPTIEEFEIGLRFTYFFDALQNIAMQLMHTSR